MKQPTPLTTFERRTSLAIDVIASTVLLQKSPQHRVGCPTDETRFIRLCDRWVRWFHANNPKWRRKLEGDHGREWCYGWIGHWADSLLLDPKRFWKRHSLRLFGGS